MISSGTIFDIRARVTASRPANDGVTVISLDCPEIAASARPGNFINVKVGDGTQPLLRRPFGIHDVVGSTVEVMVKTVGLATNMLCGASCGSTLSVLGPLGNGFGMESGDYDTALLVSGGIGTAPMRFLERQLTGAGIPFLNLVGGRTRSDLLTGDLSNCHTATDDGSEGFRGNVVELLEKQLSEVTDSGRVKIFACGPNAMLKALARWCVGREIPCELSLESVMGCGFGICYGCVIEVNNDNGGKESILLCKEGPVIDARRFIA